MDQQSKTKPEQNQNKTTELSDKDLEQVAGGIANPEIANPEVRSPRDSASGLPTGIKKPADLESAGEDLKT